MPHRRRPEHKASYPVHVTLRLRGDITSLRNKRTWNALQATFQMARNQDKIRITDFSLQHGHVHLIIETMSALTLALGMQSFCISFAKRLNKLHGRSGAVFTERYHARELRTPLEVKRAIIYVIHNARRHGVCWGLLPYDPWSSASWFDGFPELVPGELIEATEPRPTATPLTWLRACGFMLWGPVSVDAMPRGTG